MPWVGNGLLLALDVVGSDVVTLRRSVMQVFSDKQAETETLHPLFVGALLVEVVSRKCYEVPLEDEVRACLTVCHSHALRRWPSL